MQMADLVTFEANLSFFTVYSLTQTRWFARRKRGDNAGIFLPWHSAC